jgi:hypothetical protein
MGVKCSNGCSSPIIEARVRARVRAWTPRRTAYADLLEGTPRCDLDCETS